VKTTASTAVATDTQGETDMRSRSRIHASILGALLVAATVPMALAQPGPALGGDRGGRGGHGPGHGGPRGLFEFLDLTDEQREDWEAAHRSHFEALKPTLEQIRDLRGQLRAELEGDAPDAATVGGYVIGIHLLDDETEAARGDLEAAIREILTDEQEEKLAAYKAANPDRHRGRGPGGPHDGPRRGGPGFGGSPGGGGANG
jgi:Spy/CpxP family protein refolding chaperone